MIRTQPSIFNDDTEEDDSYYNRYSGKLLKTIEYKSRGELVQPYLHYIDERRLNTSVTEFVHGNYTTDLIQKHFGNKPNIDAQQLEQDMLEFYRHDFPREVSSDIFNMYNKDPQDLDFAEQALTNRFRYKILENIIDPVAKVLTKDSHMKSMVMTRSMVKYFAMMMAYMKQTDPEQYEQMQQEMKQDPNSQNGKQDGQGQPQQGQKQPGDKGDQDSNQDQDGDSGDEQDPNDQGQSGNGSGGQDQMNSQQANDLVQKLQEIMQSQEMTKIQDSMTQDAKKTMAMMDDMFTDEEQSSEWISGEKNLSSLDANTLASLHEEYNKLTLKVGGVKNAIQRLLDRSKNYFHGKEKVQFESILDSDSIDQLMDYELLHPKLRRIMLDDIMVKNTTTEGKIDIYIDISGSMSERIPVAGVSKQMTKLDFCKSFILKMKSMGLLNNIYTFDTQVYPTEDNIFEIISMRPRGGTDLNQPVNKVRSEKINSIVITDAEDHCDQYSENVFFIGVTGARFSYFENSTIQKYSDNNQVIVFDGMRIQNVDKHGNTIG